MEGNMKRKTLSLFAGLCFVVGVQAEESLIRQVDFEVLEYQGSNLVEEGFTTTQDLSHYKTITHPRFRVKLRPGQLETASMAVQDKNALLKMDLGMRLMEHHSGGLALNLETRFEYESEERSFALSGQAVLAEDKLVTYALSQDGAYVMRAKSMAAAKTEIPVDLAMEEEPLPAREPKEAVALATE